MASLPIIVTGAAGFIGYHVAIALMARGEQVIGIDNLNDYYDPQLKYDRLSSIQKTNGHFNFIYCPFMPSASVHP